MTNTKTGETLLSITAWLSRLESMRLLLAAGADPNLDRDRNYTVLMLAAGVLSYRPDESLAERVAMVRLLIDAGANVRR